MRVPLEAMLAKAAFIVYLSIFGAAGYTALLRMPFVVVLSIGVPFFALCTWHRWRYGYWPLDSRRDADR